MKKILAGSLGWLLLGHCIGARAQEMQWHPAGNAPRVTLLRPVLDADAAPHGLLGKPVALADAEKSDSVSGDQPIARLVYQAAAGDSPHYIARGQSPDLPPPPPPPDSGIPPSGDERYNCGVATQNPGPGYPILEGGRRLIEGIPWPWKGTPGPAPAGGRCKFQSDHCFDGFISPVTNPFLFEDPRSLTEVRPVFIYQSIPKNNWLFQGGNLEFFAVQARLALTDRWSIVLDKLGYLAFQPDSHTFLPDSNGFAEINVGPKFTFLRNDSCGTIGALGVTFQIPTGSAKVFQDTGTLSIAPYVSLGQQFGKSSYGTFHGLGTVGYSVATDNLRSDYLFTSLHLDYDVGNLNKIFPLIELNWFHYTSGGTAHDVGFEGADLINFGSAHVGGDDDNVSIAVGARYKFSECIQTGLAAEFPIVGRRDLMDFRITFDVIFRY